MSDSFQILDYLVVIGYLGISIGLGFAFRKQSGREEFFTAGRSMGRVTVGLSVMATLFSANSFVMYPSTAYGNSIRVLMAVVAFWLMGPIVIWVFIPVYSRLDCSTAYEYLERRFHVSVRCLASALFIVLRISWMAAATYAASLAIGAISGLNQYGVIIGLGVIAIFYTMLGGLRAVMWTDVLQFFVFFGTILFAAGLLIYNSDGGASGLVETYFADRENLVFDFTLDPRLRFATLAILIGSFLEGLSAFGADQVAVQRYIAARDVKTSQSGFFINLLGATVVIPGLLIIGMGLFSFFHHYPDALSQVAVDHLQVSSDQEAIEIRERFADGAGATESAMLQHYSQNPSDLHADIVAMKLNDQALPQFVRLKFPAGVVGLLVAALMAATMSSIDSGVHSVTTAVVVDFRDRLMPHLKPKTEAGEMRMARLMVVIIGTLAIILACYVGQLGDVFAVAKKSVGAFAAPLLAVFILGLFVPRATAFGVFFGTWIGAALTLSLMYWLNDWFAMWFFPLGFFSSIAIAMFLSLLPFGPKDKSGKPPLTFWNVKRMPQEA
tara:strand:+ start:338720 stop:340378 length:1659 start_codon:yes stop_codon:yes gene_type:complete